jgi:hypothetical protein
MGKGQQQQQFQIRTREDGEHFYRNKAARKMFNLISFRRKDIFIRLFIYLLFQSSYHALRIIFKAFDTSYNKSRKIGER